MASIRLRLHKCNTRMCGSPFDGEDVADEVALADEHDAAATNFDDDAGAIPAELSEKRSAIWRCWAQRITRTTINYWKLRNWRRSARS